MKPAGIGLDQFSNQFFFRFILASLLMHYCAKFIRSGLPSKLFMVTTWIIWTPDLGGNEAVKDQWGVDGQDLKRQLGPRPSASGQPISRFENSEAPVAFHLPSCPVENRLYQNIIGVLGDCKYSLQL